MSEKTRRGVGAVKPTGFPDWTKPKDFVQKIKVSSISGDRENPRSVTDDAEMQRFIQSVKESGILMPLVGYRGKTDDEVIVQSGHRRLDAARLLHLETVPMLLSPKPLSKAERRKLLVAYNLQRPLAPLDVAKLIRDEARERKSDPADVAEEWCQDPDEMEMCLQMLDTLALSVQKEVNLRTIAVVVGYLISQIPSKEEQVAIAKKHIGGSLSAEKIRRLVKSQGVGQTTAGKRGDRRVPGIRVAHRAEGNSTSPRVGAEYVYRIPATIAPSDVVVRVASSRGLSGPGLAQVLRWVIQTHLQHEED